jgi:quercetin dioxygenase-like cupin family protein
MPLEEEMRRRIARYEDRREDWEVFGCETQLDPRYARSQRRYIGASGSVDHDDPKAIIPTAYTMSIQTIPAGNRIPEHSHETEETFFVLEGNCTVNVFRNDETSTIVLQEWDLVSIPPLVSHDVQNNGETNCALQTLLSKTHPERPSYKDERLRELQAATYTR